jgi:pyrimidine operon attenuation protein / uracil phosphoribosyltransferase
MLLFKTMEKRILTEKEMKEILRCMCTEVQKEAKAGNFAIVGIRKRGEVLADRIEKYIGRKDIPVGYLDITLYRDDFSKIGAHPVVSETDILFNIDNKKILLVDDVLFTGRTVRAALDALIDMGRPAMVKLLVLVDRGHRELPISADFTGKKVRIKKSDMVEVRVKEIDGKDETVVVNKK